MKGTYSNCFLALLYLLLRGVARSIVLVSSPRFPWVHFLALNRHGQAIHFHHLLPDDQNTQWWFLGTFRGISKWQQEKELRQSGRRVLGTIVSPHKALAWCALAWCLAAIFWLPGWVLWQIGWNVSWATEALSKRK